MFRHIPNPVKEIKTYQFSAYTVNLTKDRIQIGCKNHSIDEWFSFSDKEISGMAYDALEWWNKHKSIIEQLVKLNGEIA